MTPGVGLRFRLWIDGRLAGEHWHSGEPGDDERAAELRGMAQAAYDAGRPWLVEAYDPSEDEGEAYVRIGVDKRGMVAPVEVPVDLAALILGGYANPN